MTEIRNIKVDRLVVPSETLYTIIGVVDFGSFQITVEASEDEVAAELVQKLNSRLIALADEERKNPGGKTR